LVEVMVSLGVMTVSALALFGMQGQAARANGRARDMTTAAQIAQNILERMKLDGLNWTTITPNDTADTRDTLLLRTVANATPGNFLSLPEITDARGGTNTFRSNAFNQFGEDVQTAGAPAATLAGVRFCASMRLAWVYDTHRVMRADVRVWWTKEAPARSILDDFPTCADDNTKLRPGGSLYESYHTVYLSTVIRPHGT
jgi:Tfp pilus assembly protein PilV